MLQNDSRPNSISAALEIDSIRVVRNPIFINNERMVLEREGRALFKKVKIHFKRSPIHICESECR